MYNLDVIRKYRLCIKGITLMMEFLMATFFADCVGKHLKVSEEKLAF
jgi:hypothetical protein